jgi:ribosomal protein S18 acetylase RimI-like enzyme
MQTNNPSEMDIRLLNENEEPPYALLLDADPSKEMVDRYLAKSEVFVAMANKQIIGVYVLCALDKHCTEIKNIAVAESFQGKGIGKRMLEDAFEKARQRGYKEIIIGTSTTSIGPLYLYQKAGFEVDHLLKNFFTDHYPQPLYENGIRCKHMIVLKKEL